MRMKLFFLGLIVLFHLNLGAQNLFANGGFEDENVCTEYRVKCAPEAWICTAPSYYFYFGGPEQAHQGHRLCQEHRPRPAVPHRLSRTGVPPGEAATGRIPHLGRERSLAQAAVTRRGRR